MNNILLINDMAGYGKVALSAMIPIMSNMKFQVYNLPTALVSNTLDYGKFDILETTGYMKNSMRVWGELGFTFDTIATGFLVSEEQTRLVAEFCEKKKDQGAFIFVDPIMGDDGILYNGVTENTVGYMRQMCKVADLIVPNCTEAAFLASKYTDHGGGRRSGTYASRIWSKDRSYYQREYRWTDKHSPVGWRDRQNERVPIYRDSCEISGNR